MQRIRIEIQGKTLEAPLPETPVRIGSKPPTDLVVACDGVAAVQCILEPLPNGGWKVADANSGIPTLVNGVAVKQVSLRSGDVLTLGAARITFLDDGVAVAPAVSERPAAPARAADDVARERPAPSKRTPSDREPAAARTRVGTSQRKLTGPLLMLAAATVAAIAIAIAVGDAGGGAEKAAAERRYEEAHRLWKEQKDYAGARAIATELASDRTAGDVRMKAQQLLTVLGGAQFQIDRDLDRLWSERLDLTAGALVRERELFLREYGDGLSSQFDAMRDRILKSHGNWLAAEARRIEDEASALIAERQFARAVDAWETLAGTAPVAVDVTPVVEGGLAVVEAAASVAAAELIEQAGRVLRISGPDAAARFLEQRQPFFAGTAAGETIAKAAADYDAAAPTRLTPAPDAPTPDLPTPEPTRPPAQPTAPAAAALAEQAAAHIAAFRFAEAATVLEGAGDAPEVAGLRSDARLAEAGFDALIADIKATPRKYRRVLVSGRLRVSLVDADREHVAAQVSGGQTKYAWTRMAPALIGRLTERMAPKGRPALQVAALLHLLKENESAGAALFRAGAGGVEPARLFPVIARWRGETVPENGYVVHEDRYVTPAEREHLLREAAIADALGRIAHRDAAVRTAAYDELVSIGEPAAVRFREALERRRLFLMDEVASSKSFTSSKYKNKLAGLLANRRRAALALIRDAQLYPYPNPTKQNQARVEELVDEVREVWDRPFDLVAQWDKKLTEHLALVTEVDEALSRLDPGYAPDLDAIKQRINAAIDMPAYAPSGKAASLREYSLKVLAFNETLETTATNQEKDNTRAVNEYRMMMGLRAVKINERLLRAARGHSRHMKVNDYFAHNVPAGKGATPANQSPGARAKTQGYGGGVGENIAMGPGTGRGAFAAWFGSSGHHRNMLGGGWTEMGCGRWGGNYWTQLFGAASGYSLKAPAALPPPAPEFAAQPEGRAGTEGPIRLPDDAPPGGGLFRDDEEEEEDEPGMGEDPAEDDGR